VKTPFNSTPLVSPSIKNNSVLVKITKAIFLRIYFGQYLRTPETMLSIPPW
jgi:hypothetical protein